MKEILIYGALVAAVLGVSAPMVQNLTANMTTQANQMNTAVQTSVDNLVAATAQAAGQ